MCNEYYLASDVFEVPKGQCSGDMSALEIILASCHRERRNQNRNS